MKRNNRPAKRFHFKRFPRRPRLEMNAFPSMVTAGNAIFGFLSIIYLFKEKFATAALFIFFASLFDFFDGRLARLLNVSSDFGSELDSLADALSFGAAPALLAYKWGLNNCEPFSVIIATLFMLSGLLRLARFNVLHKVYPQENSYFVGLPIPMAASAIYSLVLIHPEPLQKRIEVLIFALVVVLFAFLMSCTIRFKSFKDMKVGSRHFGPVIFMGLVILGLIYYPGYTIALMLYGYVIYNLIRALLSKPAPSPVEENDSPYTEES